MATVPCTECGKPLDRPGSSGLCMKDWHLRRTAQAAQVDAQIVAAALAGEASRSIASRLNCGLGRVQRIVSESTTRATPERKVADIIKAACELADIPIQQVIGKSRHRSLAMVRQAICLIGMEVGHSSTAVGACLGRRDHSTVLHSRDVALDRARRSADFAAYLADVRAARGAQSVVSQSDTITVVPRPRMLRRVKPKNNFLPRAVGPDEDDGHRFHRNVAAGSRMLLDAIMVARSA